MIFELIELVLNVHSADRAMRERGLMGESGLDREAGRLMNWLCAGAIVLIVLAPVACLVIEVAF